MNWQTILAICAIGVVVAACAAAFLRRLSGKKSCCDTKAPPPPRKRLHHAVGQFTVEIGSMRCESCRRNVTAAINAIDGASAKVSLEKRTAVVSYEWDIPDRAITAAIENAGYDVIAIRR